MALKSSLASSYHLPHKNLFLENRHPAKASVLLKLKPGADISGKTSGNQHLAERGGWPGAEDVSVLDMRGNLLSRPKKAGKATMSRRRG
jgi:flagellar biosynthesis/type III secretory pathway M-ring protein FliF/YscJ